ncbi:MAG: TetR/AcrR family transcriptional regulator, partial [Anaerolineae bacterium]|nr:TetR/AcrR family transcriptional regulator [Anaerolineae bacterium]
AERGFEAISVQDIADRAGSTGHVLSPYEDKRDLLARSMDDIHAELLAVLAPPDLSRPDLLQQNLVLMLDHVAAHARFYQVMLGPDAPGAFAVRARQLLVFNGRQRFEQLNIPPGQVSVTPELMFAFFAGACISAVQWWLEAGQPLSSTALAEDIMRLSMQGTLRILGPLA